MRHPHPNRSHILFIYRRFLLGTKKRLGRAQVLIHYREILQEYLEAKREILADFDQHRAEYLTTRARLGRYRRN
jgi:predicted SAM-dependent methyltransferase